MSKNPLVIMNSSAGCKSHSLTRELAQQRHYRIIETCYAGHGTEIAEREAEAGTSLIIACGGDGTIHEVAAGIIAAGKVTPTMATLGIIPGGTGNDLCRSLDIDQDVEAAFALLDEDRRIEIDVARLQTASDDIAFFNVSSCGFSGEVDKHLKKIDKTSWGTLAYLKSGISALADLKPFHVEISSEGETISADALNVVIGNGRYAAAGIPVAAQADIRDGKLDLVLYMGAGIADQIFNSRLIIAGEQERSENILMLRSAKFELRFSRPLSINYDGELHERKVDTLTYTVDESKLSVVVGKNPI